MSLALVQRASSRNVTHSHRQMTACRRPYSSENAGSKSRSVHAQWYAEMLPGMVPIALLGSVVYVGFRFLQASLSHERYLDETRARVQELEKEVVMLREQQVRGDVEPSVPQSAGGEKSKRRGWF
ncbi:uncharacterized protein PHACADRAFT_250344 [Phanerochaete carnosa HHB-10118-sp]|uniref:Uncharacterized protein n=1 Tax=Phanerochaete carnosa (strain HHB-10118-sp) TaxID=650164 RepID=K5X9U8_PHACS|nr:uncharacterized protein PHACADRAFT_250344 [Phanerochaete carnosa HHB-10118-sp]EKM59687.1 hypothetical protein PHACADRAFT_250344 [Phanerochaete carnosa HHB-10118-sp]